LLSVPGHPVVVYSALYSPGLPRALPSFPTRRSSDLRRPLSASLYFNRLAQRVTAALSVPTAEGALYEVDTRLRPLGAQGPLAVRDRKSTRLNSSHVKISYAVFCLKRKTTTRRETDNT